MTSSYPATLRASGTNFHLVVSANDHIYTYDGVMSIALPAFSSNSLTIAVTGDPSQILTGKQSFKGTFGRDSVNFTVDPGSPVKGQLFPPGLPAAYDVTGAGDWQYAF